MELNIRHKQCQGTNYTLSGSLSDTRTIRQKFYFFLKPPVRWANYLSLSEATQKISLSEVRVSLKQAQIEWTSFLEISRLAGRNLLLLSRSQPIIYRSIHEGSLSESRFSLCDNCRKCRNTTFKNTKGKFTHSKYGPHDTRL